VTAPAKWYHASAARQPASCRVCFRGILIRLVTGASWVDIEAILDRQVSDTTLRARRDEWIEAGAFDALKTEALAAFDRIVGLDLDDVTVDGSLRHGIPLGWAIDGAHRNDVRLLEPTLDTIDQAGPLADIGVLHLDRSYDSPTWWSNYGQLRRNTDRRPRHRHAALCLATAILIVGRLIDWRNRWSPR